MSPKDHSQPTYDLAELLELINNPSRCHITERAWDDAVELGFASDYEIIRQVSKLTKINFQHTMPSEKKPGQMQDVYKIDWRDTVLYIKLRKSDIGQGVIISFHTTI
ncbi:MAG: type II toxin-antitoxin system MqsR family toxin [Desulfuromonadales bacterium]